MEQTSLDGNGAAGAMHGTEEQAAADVVARCCWDNAIGKKRHMVVGWVAKNTWGVTKDLVTTFTKTLQRCQMQWKAVHWSCTREALAPHQSVNCKSPLLAEVLAWVRRCSASLGQTLRKCGGEGELQDSFQSTMCGSSNTVLKTVALMVNFCCAVA